MPLPPPQIVSMPPGIDAEDFDRESFAFVGDSLLGALGRDLWCWRRLTEPPARLWSSEQVIARVVARPHCGKRAAVVPGGDLWLVALDGWARRLGKDALVPATPPVWSPDGHHIAIACGERGFAIVAAKDGATRAIGGAPDADPIQWDADGLLLCERHPLGKFREWYFLLREGAAEPAHLELAGPYYTSPDGGTRIRFDGRTVHVTCERRTQCVVLPDSYGPMLNLYDRPRWAGRWWVGCQAVVALIDFGAASIAVLAEGFTQYAAATADGNTVVVLRDGELIAFDVSAAELVWSPLEVAADSSGSQQALPRAIARFRDDE